MTTEETLISYNEGDTEFQLDSAKLASVDLGAAIHELQDVRQAVVGIVTTTEIVTQYLHGADLLEY